MRSHPKSEAVPAWTLLPLPVFVGVWLALALSSGAMVDPRRWLSAGLVVALTALVTAVFAVYPRRPRQLSLLVVALMAVYVVWSAALRPWGATMAGTGAPATQALVAADVVSLLLVAMALAYLTDARARRWTRHLLVATGLVLVLAVIGRLWRHHDPSALFSSGHVSYPVGDPEGAAALLGLLFFPLVWLAADTRERVPLRAASLAAAATLAQVGVLTRSWTALAAFAGALLVTFVASPARLRTLFYLAPVALLLVRSLPALLSYADRGPAAVGAWPATYATLITLVVAATMGLALASLESWIDVSRRMRFWFGLGAVGAAMAGLALAVSRLPPGTADTVRRWGETNVHPDAWAHALVRLPTAVLTAAIICGVAGILWQRGRSAWQWLAAARRARTETGAPPQREVRPEDAWTISLLAAGVFWGLHAALASSGAGPLGPLPALLLFAFAVAEVDARAHVLWPGWSGRVRRMGARLWDPVAWDPTAADEHHPTTGEGRPTGGSATGDRRRPATHGPLESPRRTDRYARRRRRSGRRAETLRPPGPLSAVYRWLVITASTMAVAGLVWAYFTLA